MNKRAAVVYFKRTAALLATLLIAGNTVVLAAEEAQKDSLYEEKYHADVDYSEMKYEGFDRTRMDELLNELEQIIQSGDGSREKDVIRLYEEIMDQYDWLNTQQVLNMLIYYRDATDPVYQERDQELTKLLNELGDQTYIVMKAAMDTPYGSVLGEMIGENGVEFLEAYTPMTDREFELSEQELSLVQEYNEAALDSYTAVVDGEEWTTERYQEEPPEDADQNYAVYVALVKEENSVIGEIFREMVQVRTEIAKENGYDNYADYAYKEIYRRDFTTDEIRTVYQEVKENIVPLYQDMIAVESTLNGQALREVTDNQTGEEILDTLEPYIEKVDPRLMEAYSFMREHHLYDIDADDQKLEAGFTADLPSYGAAFVFNKPYGHYYDHKTMIHEFGHYNQMFHSREEALWQSARMDVYEIHSQGLEVLFYPYADDMFGEGGELFRFETVSGLLYPIETGCLYDEFQVQVYKNPDMTLEEINKTFFRMAQEYGFIYPEGADQAYGWIDVPHTFQSPMYYIGYATSALAALDIWTEATDNREEAVENYMQLTALGGEKPFREVLQIAGLHDIFQEGVIAEEASAIRETMEIDERLAELEELEHRAAMVKTGSIVLIAVVVLVVLVIIFLIIRSRKKKKVAALEADQILPDGSQGEEFQEENFQEEDFRGEDLALKEPEEKTEREALEAAEGAEEHGQS